jgi:hypothetical protein
MPLKRIPSRTAAPPAPAPSCAYCGQALPGPNVPESWPVCPYCGTEWPCVVTPHLAGVRPSCGAVLTVGLFLVVAVWLVSFWLVVCGGLGADYLLIWLLVLGCLLALRVSHRQLARHLPAPWALGLTLGLGVLLAASGLVLLVALLSAG